MARLLRLMFFLAAVVCHPRKCRRRTTICRKPGSAVVLSHSAFAHGYRHGYEEGYHVGNTDISLGTRAARETLKDFHGRETWLFFAIWSTHGL